MEITSLRKQSLCKALSRLSSSLEKAKTGKYAIDFDELRDSIIQRFEFCSDSFWKFLKTYLQAYLETDVNEIKSPRSVFKVCFKFDLLYEDELKLCINIIEDRNRTSHTYDEVMAEKIYKNIPEYYDFMMIVLNRLNQNCID